VPLAVSFVGKAKKGRKKSIPELIHSLILQGGPKCGKYLYYLGCKKDYYDIL